MKLPKISVVVAAYNEEEYLGRLLKSLVNQNYKNFEVIIVDDGSTDNTVKIAKSYNKKLNLKILKQNHKGPGEARNLGAKHANGEFIAFLDADMVCDPNSLKNLVEPLLAHKEWPGTVHNLEKVANPENVWALCAGKIRKRSKIGSEDNAFRLIRKSKFLEAGGFNTSLGYFDDGTLASKIGKAKVVEAVFYHNNPESLQEIFKQDRWIGKSYPFSLIIKRFFPIVLIFVLFVIISLYYLSVIQALLISLIMILLVLCFISFKKALREKNWKLLFFMPVFIFVRIAGKLYGIISKIFRREKIPVK